MDKKKTPTSTAEFGQTILTAQTPHFEPTPVLTQGDFLKALKKASRRKRPPGNGQGKSNK